MKKIPLLILAKALAYSCSTENQSVNASDNTVGQGGSLARFAIVNDYLYAVDRNTLKAFSIETPSKPIHISNMPLNVNLETLFPRDDSTLFIGSTDGMYIYDVSNPPNLRQRSFYRHVTACDPVVANADYAYVTLRSDQNNNWCRQSINELHILDIRNLDEPKLVREFPMINPRGLGLYGDTLLVCDAGLKVLEVSDPQNISVLTADEDFDAVDIIPYGNLMIVVGENGLQQYRFHKGELHFLSRLK